MSYRFPGTSLAVSKYRADKQHIQNSDRQLHHRTTPKHLTTQRLLPVVAANHLLDKGMSNVFVHFILRCCFSKHSVEGKALSLILAIQQRHSRIALINGNAARAHVLAFQGILRTKAVGETN